MSSNVRSLRRPVLRVGLLAVAVAIAPLPVWAGEGPAKGSTAAPGINASLEKVVATQTLATRAPARAEQAGGNRTDLGSKSFFRTPAGIATLVALAVGVGYTIYSTNNDRVKSPAR